MNDTIFKLLGISLLLIMPILTFAYDHPSHIVTFGDSLSDPGNFFAIKNVDSDSELGTQLTPPYEPDNLPSAPYAWGGHHFTNGKTWIEQLTESLQHPKSGSPAWLNPNRFSNYAVGRSRARSNYLDGVFNEVSLITQVDQYLENVDGAASSDALYVIWIGANDVSDALFVPNTAIQSEMLQSSLENIINQMFRLYQSGARRFLVLNVPDFAITPRVLEVVRTNYPQPAWEIVFSAISQASQNYNAALAASLQNLGGLPGIEIQSFDVFTALNELLETAEDHGITEVEKPCITPDTTGLSLCANPDQYMFTDGIHPTRRTHEILAEQVEDQIFQ